MSRSPKASTVPPTMASTPAGVPASAAIAMALPPAPVISAVTASAFAPSRSATATCAPRAANPMAVARPMPEPAPDTSATLPSKRMSLPPSLMHGQLPRDALGTAGARVSRNDHLLLHHEGLDASDEERAVGEEGFGLRRGVGAGHGRAVVVPKLGDAVDLDRRGGDVGARRLLADVRLHVASEPRHGVSERGVDVDPVPHELLVGQASLTREKRDALDHGSASSVDVAFTSRTGGTASCRAAGRPCRSGSRPWRHAGTGRRRGGGAAPRL